MAFLSLLLEIFIFGFGSGFGLERSLGLICRGKYYYLIVDGWMHGCMDACMHVWMGASVGLIVAIGMEHTGPG